MKKKSLKLQSLKVNSFVTQYSNNDSSKVKGGFTAICTYPKQCGNMMIAPTGNC